MGKDQSCGFANQWGTASNRVAWLNKEWFALEDDKKALLTSVGKAALQASLLSTEGSPMAFAYMEGTNIKAIIGKVTDGTYSAHYAMCKNAGGAADKCYYTTVPFNYPGRPQLMSFFDEDDVNKTVVGFATSECTKAKSVFKMLYDFSIDPAISFVESLVLNMH